jgi:hypothetical protein
MSEIRLILSRKYGQKTQSFHLFNKMLRAGSDIGSDEDISDNEGDREQF